MGGVYCAFYTTCHGDGDGDGGGGGGGVRCRGVAGGKDGFVCIAASLNIANNFPISHQSRCFVVEQGKEGEIRRRR